MQSHSSFIFQRTQSIQSLAIEISEFEHRQTGAKHFHIHANHDENVFLVALRTMPQNSSGVAHILEHTVLCGSEKFPVRDPFFMMTRRSLNTFMNAFTSSDWTAYPFASQNRKDFFNLLEVYLDAVFFSRLDPLDFAQEGHRIEFEEAGNTESDLVFKGVVYNEMKGAMSSPVSTVWQTLTKYLFPETTYHHNSGGEPLAIPDLSYDELLDFYRSHYHPSNAIFMTYGNMNPEELQENLHRLALSRFEKNPSLLHVPDERRYFAPIKVEEAYANDQPELENQTYHVLGWLLSPSIDMVGLMEAHLLSQLLFDNSSSPLRAVLETSGLGSGPSPLCGVEDSNREMSFLCGLEGSEPDKADAFEALVLDTLQTLVAEGLDQRVIEAQLHQLELSEREITGDGMPFGLQLILSGLSSAIHRGDTLEAFNVDASLEKLRQSVKDPQYIPQLIQRWLLDNPHRVRLTLRPDKHMSGRRDAAEKQRLAELKQSLSDSQKQALVAQAIALEERQQQEDDPEILPCVTLDDVNREVVFPTSDTLDEISRESVWYSTGTNGLSYQQVIVDLPALSPEQIQLLPLYSYFLTELGCAERDYVSNQAYQSEIAGSLSAGIRMHGLPEDEQNVSAYLVISGKALVRNQTKLAELMCETLESARFDEVKRIREIVTQSRTRMSRSITGNGHVLAMHAASALMSPEARYSHQNSGLEAIQAIKKLDDALDDEQALLALSAQLSQLHQLIKTAPKRFLLIGEKEYQSSIEKTYQQLWSSLAYADQPFNPMHFQPVRAGVKQLWLTDTQVNFCAMSFPSVPREHPDAAALTVLGGYLRNGFLHRAIREKGGAYGAGATQDNSNAVFKFYSYRDPRHEDTLDDFLASREWLLAHTPDAQKVTEAILGVISSIDKPGSPAGEAKKDFYANLFGMTADKRIAFRNAVLAVTAEDIQRVARDWLKPENRSVAVISNAKMAADVRDEYMRILL